MSKTDITIILDRSGSMGSVRNDTVGGFNSFLDDQKKVEGEAVLSLVQFDHEYSVVYPSTDIQKAPHLDDSTFQPRGTTALYDAIGRTINAVGDRLSGTSEAERPDHVLLVILTDGFENASREFDAKKVGELISHQSDVYQWQFVFLGANQDAILSAQQINIPRAASMTYAPTPDGVRSMYASASMSIGRMRAGRSKGVAFTDEDRKKQRKAGARNL